MARGASKLMADRLTVLLAAELGALEKNEKDQSPNEREGPVGIKARVEAVSQITRTLEKLLDLRRLEALTREEGSEEDRAETERLRAELMKRLRAIDRRRGEGAGLVEALAQ